MTSTFHSRWHLTELPNQVVSEAVDVVRLRIPYQFIRARTGLSWREVRFGLTNELLDPAAAVELALEQIAEPVDPLLVELATGDAIGRIPDLVGPLSENEPPQPDNELRDKWLYLVLAWLYEHQSDYPDPLQSVEEVYADFDYPKQLAAFVRYMPLEGTDRGSREANERRLFARWKDYLEQVAPRFANR
jgi:hypothetical protein